jgi:hypothetical protein
MMNELLHAEYGGKNLANRSGAYIPVDSIPETTFRIEWGGG